MASLYKKPVWTTDPATGEKVKSKSKKWWGRFRDALGRERRVPLARDKSAAQAMLNELVTKEERKTAGQVDPFEDHLKRPIAEHADDFEAHLEHKGNVRQHVFQVVTKVRKIIGDCKWTFLRDISASRLQKFLADLRTADELSVQTSNHYLRAIKQFCRWLVRDRRMRDDPLVHLSMLNVKLDRRHDRRALKADEFARLVNAAMSGPPVVCVSGPDRAMMYVLAAWTGYRKAEIGSLTKRSFRLDTQPPTVTVAAAYSKRKRQDTQVLHPNVVILLREWLATKAELAPDELLFPVSAKIPGGVERRTSKMMRTDLEAARKKWIEEASGEERTRRMESDYLAYQDASGEFADFHSNRHTFITNLERAGVSPRTAQSLARHSDIRLTMGVYTHIGLHDQTSAVESLPAPPPMVKASPEAHAMRSTGTDGPIAQEKVPTVVPRGAETGAVRLASNEYRSAPNCTDEPRKRSRKATPPQRRKPLTVGTIRANLHGSAPICIAPNGAKSKVRPTGFEPVTLSSEDCSPFAATTQGKELGQTAASEVPVLVLSQPGAVPAPVLPPDIAAEWDQLPDAIMAGILALIKAAGGADG